MRRQLYASPRENSRRYVCLSGPDHGGCGRLTVVAEPVEQLLFEAVLQRLDSPQLADGLAGRSSADVQAAGLAEQLAADHALLDELAVMLGKQELSPREWRAAREPVDRRMKERQQQLARATRADALVGLPGTGQQLRQHWSTSTSPGGPPSSRPCSTTPSSLPVVPALVAWTWPGCGRSGGCDSRAGGVPRLTAARLFCWPPVPAAPTSASTRGSVTSTGTPCAAQPLPAMLRPACR